MRLNLMKNNNNLKKKPLKTNILLLWSGMLLLSISVWHCAVNVITYWLTRRRRRRVHHQPNLVPEIKGFRTRYVFKIYVSGLWDFLRDLNTSQDIFPIKHLDLEIFVPSKLYQRLAQKIIFMRTLQIVIIKFLKK